jgi:hypothetical protein
MFLSASPEVLILKERILPPGDTDWKLRLPHRGWGQGGEMTQALFAHMNNKKINK